MYLLHVHFTLTLYVLHFTCLLPFILFPQLLVTLYPWRATFYILHVTFLPFPFYRSHFNFYILRVPFTFYVSPFIFHLSPVHLVAVSLYLDLLPATFDHTFMFFTGVWHLFVCRVHQKHCVSFVSCLQLSTINLTVPLCVPIVFSPKPETSMPHRFFAVFFITRIVCCCFLTAFNHTPVSSLFFAAFHQKPWFPRYQASGTRYQVPGTRYQAPGTRHRIQGGGVQREGHLREWGPTSLVILQVLLVGQGGTKDQAPGTTYGTEMVPIPRYLG